MRLSITPEDALIDVPRRIAVDGLAPGEQVEIASCTLRGAGVAWRAAARFVADAAGTVDLQRDAPVAGSYQGVSAMGLVWSQVPDTAGAREQFGAEPAAALRTDIHARRDGDAQPVRGGFVQRLAAEGVTRREVREEGLVGTLFLPAGPGPHPAVMILNGSGGGINEPRAALYASHGYAAFALGYFKAPGLSDYISTTRLEYFETALAWLHRTLKPLHGFVALSGQSRGGELVLLLGTLFPASVSAVIGYVPGAVVHCAQNACDPALGREGPAWIFRGQPLPHVWENNRTRHLGALGRRPRAAPPCRCAADRAAGSGGGRTRAHPGGKDPRSGAAAVGHRRRLLAVEPVRPHGGRAAGAVRAPACGVAPGLRRRGPLDPVPLRADHAARLCAPGVGPSQHFGRHARPQRACGRGFLAGRAALPAAGRGRAHRIPWRPSP